MGGGGPRGLRESTAAEGEGAEGEAGQGSMGVEPVDAHLAPHINWMS